MFPPFVEHSNLCNLTAKEGTGLCLHQGILSDIHDVIVLFDTIQQILAAIKVVVATQSMSDANQSLASPTTALRNSGDVVLRSVRNVRYVCRQELPSIRDARRCRSYKSRINYLNPTQASPRRERP